MPLPLQFPRFQLRSRLWLIAIALHAVVVATPVSLSPIASSRGLVVAGHPEAAAIGAALLAAGGNAIDAAVGVSLALGIAEPYGSGLGGKLMLLYHDATTGQTHAVDGMDEAGAALDVASYLRLPVSARSDGWTSVAVPGLPFALHAAHARWGRLPWTATVEPATELATRGFTVLPKTLERFVDRESRLRGDPGLAAIYLPGDALPPVGARLPNPGLAATLATFGRSGISAFREGPLVHAIVSASQQGGGHLSPEDFARYEPRFVAPRSITLGDVELHGGPPPTSGAALAFSMLKLLETSALSPPLRSAANLDLIGRAWRLALPVVRDHVADHPAALDAWHTFLAPSSLAALRSELDAGTPVPAGAAATSGEWDATTHFVIVDAEGNVVSATQSLSLHFGAGVIAAGIILNDSLSNFAYLNPDHPNFVAPGRRPRSTITPTIVLREGRPVLALGVPGAQRIPTAVAQILLDHLHLDRPLADAIGDTRVHWFSPLNRTESEAIESEASLPADVVQDLRAMGWKVDLREPPGTGRHFGGANALLLRPDGQWEGLADPRRTNAAAAP
jgi:gamma-glutamyltranspeptidase / glutathione hydrolase